MLSQDNNIYAIIDYRNIADIESANTVMVIRAHILYYDTVDGKVLFRGEARVLIDTTRDNNVSIPLLSSDDRCFCEFSSRYQEFSFNEGVLTISGGGFEQKHSYKVTLM